MNDKAKILLILFVILFGLWLRIRDLDRSGFWLDEVFSVNISRQHFSQIFSTLPKDKPPLDYYIQHFFLKIKENEFMARLPSCIFGTLTIGAIFYLTFLLTKHTQICYIASLSASALLASSALHLRYSQEARPYSLHLFLITIMMIFFIRMFKGENKIKFIDALGFILASILATFTLYSTFILLFISLIFVILKILLSKNENKNTLYLQKYILRIVIITFLIILILLIPFYSKIDTAIKTKMQIEFGKLSLKGLLHYSNVLGVMYVESQVFNLKSWWLPSSILFIPFALIGLIWLYKKNFWFSLYLLFSILAFITVPVFLFYFKNHFMSVRYILPAIIPYTVFLGIGTIISGNWFILKITKNEKIINLSRFLPTIFLCLISIFWILKNPSKRAEWKDFLKYVKEHSTPQTALVGIQECDSACPAYYLSKTENKLPVFEVNNNLNQIIEIQKQFPHLYLYTTRQPNDESINKYLSQYPMLSKQFYQIICRHTLPYSELYKFEDIKKNAIETFEKTYILDIGDEAFDFIGLGWDNKEKNEHETFRWINKMESELLICLSEPQDFNMIIRAEPFVYPDWKEQSIDIFINEQHVNMLNLLPGMNEYNIEINKAFWREGLNIIKMKYSDLKKISDVIKDSSDNREVAVRFDYIRFEKINRE